MTLIINSNIFVEVPVFVRLSIENEFWLNKSRIIGNKRFWIVRIIRSFSDVFSWLFNWNWNPSIIADIVLVEHRFCVKFTNLFVVVNCLKYEINNWLYLIHVNAWDNIVKHIKTISSWLSCVSLLITSFINEQITGKR